MPNQNCANEAVHTTLYMEHSIPTFDHDALFSRVNNNNVSILNACNFSFQQFNVIRYSIASSDDQATYFSIDATTGRVSLARSLVGDFRSEYEVRICQIARVVFIHVTTLDGLIGRVFASSAGGCSFGSGYYQIH